MDTIMYKLTGDSKNKKKDDDKNKIPDKKK